MEFETSEGSPLDVMVNDPTGLPPLCGEERFAELQAKMAADEAPRLFAIFQEYGERVDTKIAGWGMAFDGHATAISTDRSVRLQLSEPEDALHAFNFGSHIRSKLVWVDPSLATPDYDED
jgi:hypothetical protein